MTRWLVRKGLSKHTAALPMVAYALYCCVRGDFRLVPLGLALGAIVLTLGPPVTRALLIAVQPFALVGILYDGMRPWQRLGLTPERVLTCELRDAESRFFGVTVDGVRVTVHDLLQPRATLALDVIAAFPYATFILASVACALYLRARDKAAFTRFGWSFFIMNVCGFVLYHLVPAAPPWYIHTHGCAVDLTTRAFEGPNLARVDRWLGIPYFHGMYGQASSVFGAIPSLHCAYPMLVVIEGWRSFSKPWRVLSVAYAMMMIFSAVYLDHHWVIDAACGVALAIFATTACRLVETMRARAASEPRSPVSSRLVRP